MFDNDIEKLACAAEKKIKAMNDFPLGYIALSALAGAYLGFGIVLIFSVGAPLAGTQFAPFMKLIMGASFGVALSLVIFSGSELFTGNNLIVMAWADGKVSHRQLLRNWVVAYAGNFVGSLGVAAMVGLSGVLMLHDGGVAKTAIAIAEGKLALSASEAFVRGVLCNTLVCLAVWLCFSARTVVGKVMAIVFPVSAFVALGFEHSIANMYLIPIGYFAGSDSITVSGFLGNLIPVTAGNIVGGSGFVALTYWAIYLRKN